MTKKMQITLDVSKMKGLKKSRAFKNGQGETVTIDEIKLEVVPLKEEKVVFSTDKYDLVKTHFIVVPQTKEQRDAKEQSIFVGDGLVTRWKNDDQPTQSTNPLLQDDEDDIF